MWRKLIGNIKIFFISLFYGMKAADKAILSNETNNDAATSSIEEQQEVKNVLNDMLKGELTQEVIEMRHEMYFAERESKKYKYTGNGHAVKRNNIFGYSGNIEVSDNLPLMLVQDNKEDIGTLADQGIHIVGDTPNDVIYDEKALGDMRVKAEHHYTVSIERDFMCSYSLEKYLKRVVVKNMDDEGNVLVDLYIPKYKAQFDNVQKMFIKQMEKIYGGDTRNQILDFKELSFTTSGAYGADDYITFIFDNFKFENILIFDGSYILRYTAHIQDRSDVLDEIYDEATAKKCENHERRSGNSRLISSEVFLKGLRKDNYDYVSAVNLANSLKKHKPKKEEDEEGDE